MPTHRSVFAVMIGMWVLATVVATTVIQMFVPGTSVWIGNLVGGALCFAAAPVVRRWITAPDGETAAAMILEEGMCPCCLYDMSGLDRCGDVVRCPECSAGWRSYRVAVKGEVGRVQGRLDDRGRPVHMLDRRLRQVIVGEWDPEQASRVAAAKEELEVKLGPGKGFTWLVSGGIVFVALLAWYLRMELTGAATAGVLRVVLIASLPIMGMAYIVIRCRRPDEAPIIRRELRKRGLCASCGRLMEGEAPGPDGIAECRCGAAWRLGARGSAT